MSSALNVPFPKFDQRVTIVSYAETADGYGGLTDPPVETVVATEWASIEFTSGNEYFGASRVIGTGYYTITIWYNSNVTIKMAVKLGSRVFDIERIDNVGMKNEYMVLFCSESV